jgi:hypothetical protein
VSDNHLIRVNYVRERLPRSQRAEDIWTLTQQWFSTKFEHWQYEEEVRLFLDLKASESEGGLYFCNFDENSEHIQLKEVILGHRCSLEKRAIETALRSYSTPVAIIKACLSTQTFEVVEDAHG